MGVAICTTYILLLGQMMVAAQDTVKHDPATSASGRTGFANNPANGFAMDGYDPVSYIVDGKPRRGRFGIEYRWQGVAWRFANEGNRAAFMHHPEVYAPQLGGYGALAMSRGILAEANPLHWAYLNGRLYLFHSQVNRWMFLNDQNRSRQSAHEHWAKLRADRRPSLNR